MPLGSGACSGTSLPIDRALVARLFAPWEPTQNALHAVGDRDFALDWTWASARVVLALGRLATDLVDFATSEFALVHLDGAIAAGSSMMPQKKNPDVFELVRGKGARAVGNVVALLTLMKGLASGYNRDQQEDRLPLLEAGPLARGCANVVTLALPHVKFDAARGRRALDEGFTQATDLAEALVRRGVPFREAYRAVGALVAAAVGEGVGSAIGGPSARARDSPRARREGAPRARSGHRGRRQGEPRRHRTALGRRPDRVAAEPRGRSWPRRPTRTAPSRRSPQRVFAEPLENP